MNRALVLAAGLFAAAFLAPAAVADEGAPAPAPAPAPDGPPAGDRAAVMADAGNVGWWCTPPRECCPCPTTCINDPLFRLPCIDDCVDAFEKGKDASCFKLGAFAYHWWNLQNQGNHDFTYGYPTARGTYFFAVTADFECCECGTQIGGHAQLRARDESTFRSFMKDETWFYELYGWVGLGGGKLKAGKIWKRFGLDWDGTFWGNVPYYDGMKLDPDWGFSWERTWEPNQRLKIDTFAQWFVQEDGVNGSIAGADAESFSPFHERNTFVARIAPTVAFDDHLSVSAGVSGLVGTIAHDAGFGSDDTLTQWAVDASVQKCGFKAFAEYAHSDGEQNPAHYVTGGPSDVYKDWTVGAEWKIGPFTPRVVYSHGDYDNPAGSQDLWVVGGTVELTKYLTFYVEYVKWDVHPAAGPSAVYEDGFQFVLNWHL